jgi:hypothetical protein
MLFMDADSTMVVTQCQLTWEDGFELRVNMDLEDGGRGLHIRISDKFI